MDPSCKPCRDSEAWVRKADKADSNLASTSVNRDSPELTSQRASKSTSRTHSQIFGPVLTMDGLSGAASGIAVISLAIQLGDSIKKLCEFWTSVKEAPDDVRTITADLQLLSSVLTGIASEEQHFEPDPTLVTALKACRDNVTKLVRIANDMEPGFASKKPRIRIWTAFRAAVKGESIQKSQKILEGLKSTLTLALHNHHNRLNRIWHQSQQQDITTILRHLSSLNLDQPIAFRDEASRFHQTIHNPTHGVGFEFSREVAVRDVAKLHSGDQSRNIRSPPDSEDIQSDLGYHKPPSRARQQTWKSCYYGLTKSFFGAMIHTIKTTSLRSGVWMDDILNDEEIPSELEESYRILPAGWLLKLGFNCAYNFSIHNSLTGRSRFSLNPIHLVPNDALIFGFCLQGNIEMVRDLMLRNLASVRDVDSYGITALHCAAAARSPELCRFLIEAGADKSARAFGREVRPRGKSTPLVGLTWFPITQDGLVDAIDTCRIFEDSYDFWDGSGDGWTVLDQSTTKEGGRDDGVWAKFSSWFVQSSSPDIKAYYDKDQVSTVIYYSSGAMLDSIGLLLELSPPGTVDRGFFGKTPLMQSILDQKYNKMRVLLALGADPHQSGIVSVSNRVESPLSLAMHSSLAFCSFRDTLMEMNFHAEDIVHQELELGGPLLDDGWQAETLSALLTFDCELEIELPEGIRDVCSNCGFGTWSSEVAVQPYWQDLLERIKNGTYVQKTRSDTQDVQPSSSQSRFATSNTDALTNSTSSRPLSHDPALPDDQSNQWDEEPVITEDPVSRLAPGKGETWCIWCWRRFKETDRRYSPPVTETSSSDGDDSSEDDFSPFLFNT